VQQVEAQINIDPEIARQFTLWNTAGSRVLRGNLLVIPVGETILYAEPLYLQADALPYPQLTRVILATQGGDPVMEETLEEALVALVRGNTGGDLPDLRQGGTATDPDALLAEQVVTDFGRIQQALDDLQTELDVLSDRLREGLQQGIPIITTPTPTPTSG
jgi:uncharacterized membrane protein (UPF0182 family)